MQCKRVVYELFCQIQLTPMAYGYISSCRSALQNGWRGGENERGEAVHTAG